MDYEELKKVTDLIFTTYWPQITLLLGGVAFFIQRRYEYKTKKIEINHTVFQQNRINAVNNFFKSYNDAKRMWHELSVFDVIDPSKVTGQTLDSAVQPKLVALELSLLQLRFYFKSDTYDLFLEVEKNFNKIYDALSEARIKLGNAKATRGERDEEDVNPIPMSNIFVFAKAESFSANQKIIGQLCDLVRNDFKTEL